MRWTVPLAANDNEPLLPHPVSFGWRGFFASAVRLTTCQVAALLSGYRPPIRRGFIAH